MSAAIVEERADHFPILATGNFQAPKIMLTQQQATGPCHCLPATAALPIADRRPFRAVRGVLVAGRPLLVYPDQRRDCLGLRMSRTRGAHLRLRRAWSAPSGFHEFAWQSIAVVVTITRAVPDAFCKLREVAVVQVICPTC